MDPLRCWHDNESDLTGAGSRGLSGKSFRLLVHRKVFAALYPVEAGRLSGCQQ